MRRLLALAALALSACAIALRRQQCERLTRAAGPRAVAPILNEPEARDWHSFARPEVARVTHVALDLALDFEARRIGGTATLDLQAADGAQEIVLDNKGLEISAVTDAQGQALPFAVGEGDAIRGHPVTVRMGAARQIRIAYRSAPRCGGAAMADPAADRRRAASLSVQPGPGDPQPDLDSDPGQPRHPPDLGSADHRADAAHRRHVGRPADPRGRGGRRTAGAPSASG